MEWITKEGNSIAVEDMELSHIANTIKMLERHLEEYKEEIDYDWIIPELGSNPKQEMLDWIQIFKEELKKRTT